MKRNKQAAKRDLVKLKLDVLKAAVEACTFDQYGCLYSAADARRVVVAARALLGLPAMPEN